MSELTKQPPLPNSEIEIDENEKTSSPWSVIFTMLLLILGFLLAGVMMIQQTIEKKSENGEPITDLTKLAKHFQQQARTAGTPAGNNEMRPSEFSSSLSSFKQIIEDQTGKVQWSRLELIGFGKSRTDENESFAIINGTVLHLGESIGQVTLVEIRDNGVVVEYNGERTTLRVTEETD